MFKWLTKQSVESDKGFIVQSAGRFTHEYIEQSKKLIIVAVDQGKKNGRYFDVVKSDNFEKWEDGTHIIKERRDEIKRNYIEAMVFQGIDIIIDDKPSRLIIRKDESISSTLIGGTN